MPSQVWRLRPLCWSGFGGPACRAQFSGECAVHAGMGFPWLAWKSRGKPRDRKSDRFVRPGRELRWDRISEAWWRYPVAAREETFRAGYPHGRKTLQFEDVGGRC